MQPLQLWGGPECTVNRSGDAYLDQTRLSGHQDRLGDLDLFAGLGITAIRYPVLWERVSPDNGPPQWHWYDERLGRLRQLGMRPIAGLVHHGSGPRHTDLLDDGFAPGLGRHAAMVAERYPWIEDWTPVNEPLTTARFSCLYGHWYPHARDEASFWLALVNQVDGTRAAMQAIRRVNSSARLIQTDDLGRTYATTRMAEQAGFDNLRRWAGWDLLFGRITPHHPLWERIARAGLGDRLRAIADDPCPPDVVGVNHYLTSDRFLDHRLQRYPQHTHGGNERMAYADTEAVRVLDPPPPGLAGALGEAWQRYGVPLAITEVHNGCTREEQLRWAAEAWDTALAFRASGGQIEAVTAWALLGSQGWNTLLTAPGIYETGVFDISGGAPRPTALASLWRALPTGGPRHPVASETGWWHRPERLLHRTLTRPSGVAPAVQTQDERVLLICGATGTLGQAFARACAARGIRHVVTARDTIDLERPDTIAGTLDRLRPWGVVNATGWVRVDDAEAEEAACMRVNATGAVALAQACADRGIACLGFSSDLVFDGAQARPYVESDAPRPLSAYGRSKAALEAGCAGLPGVLVARTAAFFSADDPHNFAWSLADTLSRGQRFVAAADHVVTPTFVPALVDTGLDLLIDGAEGIWHIAGSDAVSWAEFALRVARACDLNPALVIPVAGEALGWRAPRPRYAALGSERGATAARLDDQIHGFAQRVRGRFARAA
ncbi:family 1 glycosylhydrolase [Sphingomonas jatrophae]|uniref:dTDP-4-dehydrorhamnose reductase n=1 Tax=Sphingomonas jatrophae TaxID=1166337 RepID=A0A1I6K2M3_9SPHN|nr:family 1 glycosylhydrolase [Sphingomonas jatrophae]SFR85437.1 dTDP-4-dehydrorhamnose reductase [Sphingomonas jatrophae]